MSMHKSLKIKSSLSRSRNVLTRAERLERLLIEGRLDEKSSVFGLPKVRVKVIAKLKKKKKKEEDAATPAAAAAAPGADKKKK